jgi:hypothetical protein
MAEEQPLAPRPGYRPGHFIYTTDSGVRYRVKIARRFGENAALGFDPDDISVQNRPATGLVLRHVNVVNRDGCVRRRSLPVGSRLAPILTTRTIDLYEPPLGTTLPFVVSSYIGEKRRGLA